MRRHRYKTSFLVTASLYAFAAALYLSFPESIFVNTQKPKEDAVVLALSQFSSVPLSESTPLSEPQEEPTESSAEDKPTEREKTPQEKPEPIRPPEDKMEANIPTVTKPLSQPARKSVTKSKRKKRVDKSRVSHKRKHTKKRKKKHSVSAGRNGGEKRYSAAKRNAFLARVRSRIDRAKRYPKIAKRRGMQGVVHAKFTVFKNGSVGAVSLRGPKIFQKSAKQAIIRAFPVDTANAGVSFPITVRLSLRYSLH